MLNMDSVIMEDIDWLYFTNFLPLSTLLNIPKLLSNKRTKQDIKIKPIVG